MSEQVKYPFIAPKDVSNYATKKVSRKIMEAGPEETAPIKLDALYGFITKGVIKTDTKELEEITNSQQRQIAIDRAQRLIEEAKKRSLQEGLHVFFVRVMAEDGMSWSAQSVYDTAIKELDSNTSETNKVPVIALKCKTETISFTQVINLVGENKFNQLLLKTKLHKKRLLGANAKILFKSIAAVVAGILGNWLFELFKGDQSPTGLLPKSVVILLVAAVAFLIQLLADRNTDHHKGARKDRPDWDDLLKDSEQQEKLDQLKELVVTELKQITHSRLVIIDNYETLDIFSKEVLSLYFKDHKTDNHSGNPPDYWIIFEPMYGDALSREFGPGQFNHEFAGNLKVFEQQPLSRQEKKWLTDQYKLQDKDVRLNNTTVRAVCHGLDDYKWVNEAINACRAGNDDQFELHYLVFLSLASGLSNVEFSNTDLNKIFTTDHELRGILKFYFGTKSKTWSADYKDCIQRLESNPYLKKMIHKGQKGKTTYWQIISEVGQIVATHSEFKYLRWRGHAFWAMYLYEKQPAHTLQAIYFKKIALHLSELDFINGFANYPEENLNRLSYESILEKLLDIFKFTLLGMIRTCLVSYRLFDDPKKPLVVKTLSDKIITIIRETDVSIDEAYLVDLLDLLWRIYFLCFDENLLLIIDQLNTEIKQRNNSQDEPVTLTKLEKVFYDSLPLTHDTSRNLKPHLKPNGDGSNLKKLMPNYHYMQTHTMWLALLLRPTLAYIPQSTYQDVLSGSYKYGNTNFRSACTRIRETDRYESAIIDVLHLSTWTWTETVYVSLVGHDRQATDNYYDNLEETLSILKLLKESKQLAKPASGEYLLNSLINDTAVNVLASLYFYSFCMAQRNAFTETVDLNRINTLFAQINVFLDSKIKPFATRESLITTPLIEYIDEYLELTSMMWKRLQMDQLYNLTIVKRIHYNALFSDFLQHKQLYLSKITGATNNENVYTRLFITLSKIIYKENSTELRDKYVNDTYHLINNPTLVFGDIIKEEILIASFLNNFDNTAALEKMVPAFIKGLRANDTILYKFLQATKREDLQEVVNRTMHTVNEIDNPSLKKDMCDTLEAFINDIEDDECKVLIEGQFKYHIWTDSFLENKGATVREAIQEWKDYKDRWFYPGVIELCFIKNPNDPLLQEECLQVMSDKYENTTYNSRFRLSVRYLKNIVTQNEKDNPILSGNINIAAKCLHGSIREFKGVTRPAVNVEAYRLLSLFETEHKEEYLQQKQYWENEHRELESLKNFISSLNSKNFCLAFENIIKKMLHFGLIMPHHTDDDTLPFIEHEGKQVLNSAFYERCAQICNSSDTDPRVANKYNDLAKQNIVMLIDYCFEQEGLPSQFKTLLNEYRDQADVLILSDEQHQPVMA